MKKLPRLLIDGYNLLHALGLPPGPLGPHGLERARGRMLQQLAAALAGRVQSATVVFDARHPPPGRRSEDHLGPLDIVYAVRHGEADELIEELVRGDGNPRELTVVSNDHRVQRAAHHRRCTALGCDAFFDWLERDNARPSGTADASDEVRRIESDEEKAHWIEEFGDLEADPAFREIFRRFDFGEE